MAKKDKKTITHKKLLIRDGILLGANVAGGVTGLALASNILLTGLSVATLGLSTVWVFLGVKAIKAIKAKKENLVLDNDKYNVHKRKYKQALREQKKEIKNEKVAYKKKKKEITKTTSSKAEAKSMIKYAKIEEKGHLKSIPKKSKPYKIAKGFAIVSTILATAATILSGFFFVKEFESADAFANESNQNQNQFLDTENTINLGLSLGLAGIQVANTIVAVQGASNIARKREDDVIEHAQELCN